MTSVLFINVLHDLLSALMLKININVGRFVTIFANEAFEQQIDLGRVDAGNAQAVANG